MVSGKSCKYTFFVDESNKAVYVYDGENELFNLSGGAGTEAFTGVYDGNGKGVKETSTGGDGVGGVVGVLTYGLVANCLAGDVYVINSGAKDRFVGMVVGYVQANGTVQNCYSPRVGKNFGYFTYDDNAKKNPKSQSLATSNTKTMGQVYGYLGGTA